MEGRTTSDRGELVKSVCRARKANHIGQIGGCLGAAKVSHLEVSGLSGDLPGCYVVVISRTSVFLPISP
jgi:hypothetical protein